MPTDPRPAQPRECPFCGRSDEQTPHLMKYGETVIPWYVVCGNCGAQGPPCGNPDDALKEWDERAIIAAEHHGEDAHGFGTGFGNNFVSWCLRGHEKIGFNDPDDSWCPLCALRTHAPAPSAGVAGLLREAAEIVYRAGSQVSLASVTISECLRNGNARAIGSGAVDAALSGAYTDLRLLASRLRAAAEKEAE